MRLLTLTIHNLASVEDAIIDFAAPPLADSEIFLISGTTGAGKTTILDAICLALYGNTPRMQNNKIEGSINDNSQQLQLDDVRQLMRRNTAEAFTKLTFVGSNGTPYEAVWQIKRAHKKVNGRLQDVERQLTNLHTNHTLTKITEVKKGIQEAIGLTFDQFCRTTMLAQGQFTVFLNSKDNDKADILEKITGVTQYTKIGEKIYEITQLKLKEYEAIKLKIDNITLLTEEQLTEKNAEQINLKDNIQTTQFEIDTIDKKLQWHTQDNELTKQIIATNNKLNLIEQQLQTQEYKNRLKIVNDWNATIEQRQWLVDRTNAQKKINTLYSEYIKLQNDSPNERLQYIPQLTLDQITILQTTLETKLNSLKLSLTKQDAELASIITLLKQKETKYNELQLPSLRIKKEQLSEYKNNVNLAIEQQHILTNEINRHEQEVRKLNLQKQEIDKLTTLLTATKDKVLQLEQASQDRKNELETQKLYVNDWAVEMRKRLHTNEQCPVCGQTIGLLPHDDDFRSLYTLAEEKYNNANKEYIAAKDSYAQLYAKYEMLKADISLTQTKVDSDRSLQQAQLRLQQTIEKINIKNENLEQLLSKQLHIVQQQIDNLSQTIIDGEVVEVELNQIRKTYQEAQQQMHVLDNQRTSLEKSQLVLQQINGEGEEWRRCNTKIQKYICAHTEFSEQYLQQLHTYTHDTITIETQRLNNIQEEKNTVIALLQNLQQRKEHHQTLKDTTDANENIETLTQQRTEKSKTLHDYISRQGALLQQLNTDKQLRAELSNTIVAANNKLAEYKQWDKLNQLLGDRTGKKFKTIAQSYVLVGLIHSANQYMHSLTDRYTLHVEPGTFAIMIEDAYQGYTRRSTSTISGGESFIVSLALALALSDISSRLAVDTLFIDEGFGSLSGEPLQKAINTLRTLHSATGRHVGIISHIEELKERIPTQIQVMQKSNHSYSTIQVV